MGYSGMNAAVVERVSRDLHACSGRIDSAVRSVDSIIARAQQAWVGADATRFASGWHADRSSLSSLSGALESLSRTASNQAAAQRRASNS